MRQESKLDAFENDLQRIPKKVLGIATGVQAALDLENTEEQETAEQLLQLSYERMKKVTEFLKTHLDARRDAREKGGSAPLSQSKL